MGTTERQQGMHAALTVLATTCERHIERGDAVSALRGESATHTQFHRVAVSVLRAAAEAIRVEAMLPPDAARDLSARLSRLADVLDRTEPDSEHARRIERALGECSHGATVAAVNVAGVA